MASRLSMDVAGGLTNLPAREILAFTVDPRDIHIGASNPWADTPGGSDQERYNRKALPWEGAAYTLVGGSWVKVGGRTNAVDGAQLESQFPNLAQVWQQFARAQSGRPSGEGAAGSLTELRSQLVSAAQNVSEVGRMRPEEGEGQSLRALKQSRKGR